MNNNRDSLLKEVQMYGFAAHECNLYLDCHPDNRKALLKHAEMVKKYNEAVAKYESIYGPLTANAANIPCSHYCTCVIAVGDCAIISATHAADIIVAIKI